MAWRVCYRAVDVKVGLLRVFVLPRCGCVRRACRVRSNTCVGILSAVHVLLVSGHVSCQDPVQVPRPSRHWSSMVRTGTPVVHVHCITAGESSFFVLAHQRVRSEQPSSPDDTGRCWACARPVSPAAAGRRATPWWQSTDEDWGSWSMFAQGQYQV